MSTATYATSAFGPFRMPGEDDLSKSLMRDIRFGAMTFRRPDPETVKRSTIMIVDDDPTNVKVVRKFLQDAGYQSFVSTTDSTEALDMIRHENPDIIILDIIMPDVDGLEILETMYTKDGLYHIPVLILTAKNDAEVKLKALDLGATDFLLKPVDPSELTARVRNTLLVKAQQDQLANYSAQLEYEVRLRTAELAASRQEAIHCLARAAEYRDSQTGHHVIRVGRYSAIIARELGFDEDAIALLEQAAQLHDVGKIGVPDAILKKTSKLDADEFDIIQRHCGVGQKFLQEMPAVRKEAHEIDKKAIRKHTKMGAGILETCNSPVMRLAARVAHTHHEKWDGTGYPLGLAGEEIPIEGRIVAVADVFDALRSKRPYKDPLPPETCFEILEAGRGSHFDAMVLDAFFARKDDILRIQATYTDGTSP